MRKARYWIGNWSHLWWYPRLRKWMYVKEIDKFQKKTGMKFGYGCHYHPKDAKDAWAMFRKCGEKFPDAEFYMVKVLGKREVMWQYGKEVVSDVDSGVL